MLNRKYRFHGYGALKRVYSQSQNIRGPLIGLRYSERKPGKSYRVAVVVGRKVNKSAVVRNRIRRRIFEVIRLSDKLAESTDYIFTVYDDQVAEMPSLKLTELINNLISKVN